MEHRIVLNNFNFEIYDFKQQKYVLRNPKSKYFTFVTFAAVMSTASIAYKYEIFRNRYE